MTTQDPSHKTTIRGSTTSTNPIVRVEHTIGLYIDKKGQLQRTRTFTGDLDGTEVDWSDYEDKMRYVVGTAHTHPGGPDSEHFSADTSRRPGDESFARNFLRNNRQFLHPRLGVQLYMVHSGGILNWDVGKRIITSVSP